MIVSHVVAQSANEEYRVYDEVVKSMFSGDKVTFDTQAKIKQIVIRDQTATEFAFSDKKENWGQVKTQLGNKISDELIANYEAVHDRPTLLTRSFELNLKYSLFSKKDYDAIFDPVADSEKDRDRWMSFYEKYPDSGGYIMLSNVGFNKAKDQALVYFVHWCGGLCGTGHYIVLTKSDKGWEMLGKTMIWIS